MKFLCNTCGNILFINEKDDNQIEWAYGKVVEIRIMPCEECAKRTTEG